MSDFNNTRQTNDPSFDPSGKAAVGEFYSSGGQNSSTGREPFEDTSRGAGGLGGGDNYGSSTTDGGIGGVGGATSRTGTTGVGAATGGFEAGRNTGDTFESSRTGGITGTGGDTYGSDRTGRDYDSTSRTGGTGTGTAIGSGISTGEQHSHSHSHSHGEDRSAGYDRTQGGPGNQGVSQFQGSETSGPVSAGAAGTDRFDVDRESSGAYGEGEYGQHTGDKAQTNQGITRSGRDFTGGPAATGGAYTNEHAKTGLTGRETTTTGVHDQHGNDTQKQGLLDKVKNAIGGHKNDHNANQNQ